MSESVLKAPLNRRAVQSASQGLGTVCINIFTSYTDFEVAVRNVGPCGHAPTVVTHHYSLFKLSHNMLSYNTP